MYISWSHVEKIYTSIEYHLSGFVPKSVLDKYLEESLCRVCEEIRNEKEKAKLFEVRIGNRYEKIKVPISDILYFESANRKIYMYTMNAVFELKQTGFEKFKIEMCRQHHFIETHRLCIVNITRIYSVKGMRIEFDNNKVLEVSRRHVKEVEKEFEDYLQ